MAFPVTTVLDDFNRADGDPGANWTSPVLSEASKLDIVSQQAVSGAGSDGGYWNVTTFGPNSEVYFTIVTKDGNCELYARIASPGSSANGYMLRFLAGFAIYRIFRLDAGVATKLGADTGATTIGSGSKLGFEAAGSSFSIYENLSGSWALFTTRTDPTYTAAGYIGCAMFSGAAAYDDFGGGSIGGAPPAAQVPITVLQGQRW